MRRIKLWLMPSLQSGGTLVSASTTEHHPPKTTTRSMRSHYDRYLYENKTTRWNATVGFILQVRCEGT